MNAWKNWSRKRSLNMAFGLVTAAALLMLTAPQAIASTAANTTITNSVRVTFDNAAGFAQTPINATTSVLVNLVAAAPTLDSPASIDPTTENTLNVVTYTITGNANGADAYTLMTANGHDANLNAASLVVNGGAPGSGNPVAGANITLGGTTLAAAAPIGATQITVPYDSNADGDTASTNGITAGDTIMIGGNPYVVGPGGISENAGSNLTTITLVGTIAGAAGSVGDVVGERATFTVDATTSTLISGGSGVYTLSTTAASVTVPGETTTQTITTLITVRKPLLSVVKYVQNVDAAVVGGGASISVNTGGGAGLQTYYTQNVTGVPGQRLEYVVVVENPTGSGVASDVIIEDQIPQFTAYVTDSLRLDPGTGTFGSVTDVATDTDKGEYDSTPGSETVWIYAGTGGGDTGTSGSFGDGTGGSLNGGETTRGVFRVTIQ